MESNEEIKNVLAGNTAFNREAKITFLDVNFESIDENGIKYAAEHTPEWYAVGEDNDELTRERNDSVDSSKNVLGRNNITTTLGAQTTEVDPYKIRGNDKLSYALYMIDKYDLKDDKAKMIGMEVFYCDVQSDGVYGAWTESAIISINSSGGDTTALNYPAVLNWCGDKKHGTFATATKTFTKTTVA